MLTCDWFQVVFLEQEALKCKDKNIVYLPLPSVADISTKNTQQDNE